MSLLPVICCCRHCSSSAGGWAQPGDTPSHRPHTCIFHSRRHRFALPPCLRTRRSTARSQTTEAEFCGLRLADTQRCHPWQWAVEGRGGSGMQVGHLVGPIFTAFGLWAASRDNNGDRRGEGSKAPVTDSTTDASPA